MTYQLVEKTDRLLQLEALVPRLKTSFPAYRELSGQLGKDFAGFLGEKNLRYHFEFIKSRRKLVHLAGLRLRGSTFFTQLDHLIATPEILFIIEAKHRKGLISVNQHGQYVQRYANQLVTFDNPENQVDIQKQQLDYILRRHGFPPIPIVALAAFTHDTVQLDSSITSPEVMVAQEVSFFINDILAQSRQPCYNNHQLKQMKILLKKLHEPLKVNLIADYKISLGDLNPGVLCRACRKVFMRRDFATWTCPQCGLSDCDAHHRALRDYARLFEPTINNRTARMWLGIECKSLSHRLLKDFPKVDSVGKRGVQYDLSQLIKK